eukprot:5803094-Alexandrium_andersonii.AAC.1
MGHSTTNTAHTEQQTPTRASVRISMWLWMLAVSCASACSVLRRRGPDSNRGPGSCGRAAKGAR